MPGAVLLAVGSEPTRNLSMFDPASPSTESIRTLTVLVFAIIGLIFVVVEGVLIYSVLRFRRRAGSVSDRSSPVAHAPGSPGPGAEAEPPQVYGSKPIEIAWTAAPTLVVFLLVLVITRTLWEVNVDKPAPDTGDNALHVTVVGKQWWWEYRYDHFDGIPIQAVDRDGKASSLPVITANELHVPASDDRISRRVHLTLKSADVCHSYWVPRLAGKTDVIPGKTNTMWFETKQTGLFVGQCAEYCGTQHANMLLRVVVHTPEDFQRWLDEERKPALDAPLADAEAEKMRVDGKAAFLKNSCVNCHRIRGTSAAGDYAPDLTHLMSRETLGSGMIENNEKNLKSWIRNPQRIKVGCLMPAFGLTERDLDLMVHYLKTLR